MTLALLVSGLVEFGAGALTLANALTGRNAYILFPNVAPSDEHAMLAARVGATAVTTFGGISYILAYFLSSKDPEATLPLSLGALSYHVALAVMMTRAFFDGTLTITISAKDPFHLQQTAKVVGTGVHTVLAVWFIVHIVSVLRKRGSAKKKAE